MTAAYLNTNGDAKLSGGKLILDLGQLLSLVANSGSNIVWALNSAVAMTGNTHLFELQNNGDVKFTVTNNGTVICNSDFSCTNGTIRPNTTILSLATGSPLALFGNKAAATGAVGVTIGPFADFSGSSQAKLATFTNNGGASVKAYVAASGGLGTSFTDSSGTPGDATNNSPSGLVSLAAVATSLILTNSCITNTSQVMRQVVTNDTTLKSVVCVNNGDGTATITANAAATGTTNIFFVVFNGQ